MKLPKWANKLPKKVTICGYPYKIIYNMATDACFNTGEHIIKVGCNCPQALAREMLFHEISEIIHIEIGSRHCRCTDSYYLFAMDHVKFSDHNMLLVAALKDCGLLR